MSNNPECGGVVGRSELKKFIDNQLWPAAKELVGGDIRNYQPPSLSVQTRTISSDVLFSESCVSFCVNKYRGSNQSGSVSFSFTSIGLLANIWTKAACQSVNSPISREFMCNEFVGRREDGTDQVDIDLQRELWKGRTPPLTAVVEYISLDLESYDLSVNRRFDYLKLLDGRPIGSFNSNPTIPAELLQQDDGLDSIVLEMDTYHESYWDERDLRLAKFILDALGLYSPRRDQPAL